MNGNVRRLRIAVLTPSFSSACQLLVLRPGLMRGEHLQARVVEHRHPARDELRLGLNGGALVEGGFDAAAARVAHDDQVLDAQIEHGELDGRADAVELAAGLVGRHQVGDVAHDEQLARHGAEDRFRIDAAVAARDDHRLGVLPVGSQLLVLLGLRQEVPVMEAAEAVGKFFGEAAHGVFHAPVDGGARRCQIVRVARRRAFGLTVSRIPKVSAACPPATQGLSSRPAGG